MTEVTRPVRRPLRRRLVFFVLMLGVLWVGIELCAFGAYWVLRGEAFSFEDIRAAQRAAAEEGEPEDAGGAQLANPFGVVLHPYLGYVVDPVPAIGASRANAHGFVSRDGPIVEREPNTVVIGVFGGSVAEMFYTLGTTELERALREHPALADKRFRFLGFGLGGYKQPQQFFALSYVLGLGGEFDVAICIDGFNEVALPPTENVRAGVFPMYPRGWNVLARSLIEPAERRALGDLQALRVWRRGAARVVAESPLGWSVLANLVWTVADRRLADAITTSQGELQARRSEKAPFHLTGPTVEFANDDALYDALVATWRDSAVQMDRLCRANGVRFFHFLQPNQYVAGSKSIGAEERALAVDPDSRFRVPVERGYPKLRAAGAELVAAGVEFVDLTRIFAGVDEALYIDSCCHFNQRGNELVARAIAAAIKASYDGEAVDPGRLTGLVAKPDSCVLGTPLATRQLVIEGEFDDGSMRDVTFARVAFRSNTPAVVAVTEFGVVEALRPGRATIVAEKGGHRAEIEVKVEFPPIVAFGKGVAGVDGPRLEASFEDTDRVRLELDRVERDAPAVLLVSPVPARSQLCDARLLVPLIGSIHVPLPVAGVRGTFVFDPPAHVRGTTTYWQALARDKRAACDWWATNGVAVTIPD